MSKIIKYKMLPMFSIVNSCINDLYERIFDANVLYLLDISHVNTLIYIEKKENKVRQAILSNTYCKRFRS